MKLSLSIAKYTAPSLPVIVDRPRLIRRLDRNRNKKVVLVSGQAAQGKSTLVAAYLNGRKDRTAWLHLDREESDHVNFFYLLVHALQFALQRKNLSGFLNHPHISLGTREEIPRYREQMISLLNRLSSPVRIVLDGLDCLAPDASSLHLIDTMCDNIPDGSVLYLITRIVPPLKLQRLKINRTALSLSNDDLAFSGDEIKRFFRMAQGIDLSEDKIEKIREITGGWTGGLVLISEALNRLPEAEKNGYLDHQLPGALQNETLTYFSEEIFNAQPEGIKTFLIKSSLIDVIEPELLAHIVDEADVDGYIQELVRRNLFIQAIYDEDRGWTYRYNQLFKTFLQSMVETTLGATARRALLKKTAVVNWERDRFEDAIRYYLKAEAFVEAAAGIKKIGTDLAICGRMADLSHTICALPTEMIREDPWLLYFLTLTRKNTGGSRNLDDLKRCLAGFEESGDTRGRMLCLAFFIETLAFLGGSSAEIARWTMEGERLLYSGGLPPYYAYAKTLLWLQIGFGQITGGNLQKGLSACSNAFLMARKIDDTTLQINATIVSVLGWSLAGEFQQADEALETLGRSIGGRESPEYRTLQHLVKIDLALNKGHFETATRLLEKARRDIETFGLLFLYPSLIDATGLLHIYRRDFDDADRMWKHLSDVAVLSGNSYYEALSYRLAGMLQYHKGRYQKALVFAGQAADRLAETAPDSFNAAQVNVLAGLIHLHLGEYPRAESLLTEALHYFTRAGSPLASVECRLALSLVRHAQGNGKGAEAFLAEGFRVAEAKQYEHMPIMSPVDFLRACALATELAVSPVMTYAARLFYRRSAVDGPVDIGMLSLRDVSENRETLKNLKRLIHRTRVPLLEIRTLGGFCVFRDSKIPIAEREWTGQRPKTLLKAILVHGNREIPKDMIMDDLWPDCSPEAARKNLKVTLHRLRKVLEPDLNPDFGSAYIHLKNNMLSLDRELCRIDVDRFLDLFKKIRHLWETGDPEEVLLLCHRAENIYRGDFLPEEPYLYWTDVKRNMLKELYVDILTKTADLYGRMENLAQAANYYRLIVRADPYQEQAQQQLMRAYAASGMKSAALKVYESFKRFTTEEIGETPDPSTTALYRKILQNR